MTRPRSGSPASCWGCWWSSWPPAASARSPRPTPRRLPPRRTTRWRSRVTTTEADGEAGHGDHEAEPAPPRTAPAGWPCPTQGYTLRLVSEPRPGTDRPLRFVIDGPDGEPVTTYDEVHDQRLHLVKIRRDGADYQHVHPTLRADGTWTAPARR